MPSIPNPDPTFARRAAAGLVWLPECGMGHYPVRPRDEPYDRHYFDKYVGYAQTATGRRLTEARLALVRRHWDGPVLDVGVGCGQFVEAHGRATGYDVNPAAVAWLRGRGLYRDPYRAPVDALTAWDALEHVRRPARLVAAARRWLFLALPIVPGCGPPPPDWRHYRRDEHRWYWTRAGLIAWLAEQGFELVELSLAESEIGRGDIESFAFGRADAA
jgi:hypothetical protein